ncbi:hypothetical protein H310_13373 [Aphanomyces invadans]|uniref:Chromo domain-containing protein n=1 Tax=Aphanomyces invadans TaxID=157072 RepID=A0A024TE76_9STRA|nr:hypothetical protein H310_13373 [Aphanomyces invadans]ETV92319.1 hypothetical protein H310_13373 [Aphanomyces invadans]|eukprot:XP_008879070.1 hypothetical protein H310_13373 [Aphanomyces invadans]
MYHEGGREVTEDLVDQLAFGYGGFHVERLEKVRKVADGSFQVLVKWLGLEEDESSWELAKNLLEDIPVVFRKWCESKRQDRTVGAMMKSVGLA